MLNSALSDNIAAVDWSYIIPLATGQGISALVWDNIQQAITDCKISTEQQLSKVGKIKLALTVENIILQYHRRKALSIEIADIWAKEGIKTYGLKGWALSTYYPTQGQQYPAP